MPCVVVPLSGGGHAIVKMSEPRLKRCFVCGQRRAGFLCDFPVTGTGTCDRPLCKTCKTLVAGKDLCPEHVAQDPQADLLANPEALKGPNGGS